MGTGSVITFQWYLLGVLVRFLAYQHGFIGDPKGIGLMNTLANPSPAHPQSAVNVVRCNSVVAAATTVGAVAKRGRLMPAMVWAFLWATPVYCPIACWP